MKTPIEVEAFFDDNNTVKDLLDIVQYCKLLGEKRGKVTILLHYQDCTPETITLFNKALEFKISLPDNVHLIKFITPSLMREKGFEEKQSKYYDYYFQIKSFEDAEILKEWNIICRSVIFKVNTENIDDIIKGFKLLYTAGQQVTNFVNIKLDRDSLFFTDNIKNSLSKFLKEFLPGRYYFNKDDENIYCVDNTMPIKGIRSIKKQFLKYTYIQECGSLRITPRGDFFVSVNWQPITKEELLNMEASPDETTIPMIGIKSKYENMCSKCELNGLCEKVGNIIWYLEDIYQFSCEEVKYWHFLYELAKEICSTDVPPGARII